MSFVQYVYIILRSRQNDSNAILERFKEGVLYFFRKIQFGFGQ